MLFYTASIISGNPALRPPVSAPGQKKALISAESPPYLPSTPSYCAAAEVWKDSRADCNLSRYQMTKLDLARISTVRQLQSELPNCRLCPRLNQWQEKIARDKVARFRQWDYWGKPIPSLGKANARLLVVGLAPAAHGANRTGRMFTGDRSGAWLYHTLHKYGFASQPYSLQRNDQLRLIDCYITAVLHCPPPLNKPNLEEISNCRPYLQLERKKLTKVRVVLALGRLAFDSVWKLDQNPNKPSRPHFRHGLEVKLDNNRMLIVSFHPSQQNTFTGKLTQSMFDSVFRRIREIIDAS